MGSLVWNKSGAVGAPRARAAAPPTRRFIAPQGTTTINVRWQNQIDKLVHQATFDTTFAALQRVVDKYRNAPTLAVYDPSRFTVWIWSPPTYKPFGASPKLLLKHGPLPETAVRALLAALGYVRKGGGVRGLGSDMIALGRIEHLPDGTCVEVPENCGPPATCDAAVPVACPASAPQSDTAQCAFTAANPSAPPPMPLGVPSIPQQSGPVWQVWEMLDGNWGFSMQMVGDRAIAEKVWMGYIDLGKTAAFIELQRNPDHFWYVTDTKNVPPGLRVCDPAQPPAPTGTCHPTQTYNQITGLCEEPPPPEAAPPVKKGSAAPLIAVLVAAAVTAIIVS